LDEISTLLKVQVKVQALMMVPDITTNEVTQGETLNLWMCGALHVEAASICQREYIF
jgi:hypothetical protein